MLIGGFPANDGDAYADIFPAVGGVMAFPDWGPFEGPDAVDLGPTERERIPSEAIPVPEGVSKGVVRLTDGVGIGPKAVKRRCLGLYRQESTAEILVVMSVCER